MHKIFITLCCILPSIIWANDPFALPTEEKPSLQIYKIHYADAEWMAKTINHGKTELLSKKAYVMSDKSSNALLVYDNEGHRKAISDFIDAFDQPQPQILINAMIVIIDKKSMMQLGAYLVEENTDDSDQNTDNLLSTVHLPLVKFGSENSLQFALTALEKKGHAVIVSEPQLITLNRHTASIASGDEIPYSQKTEETSTTLFKKALLQLAVTPTLLPNEHIRLSLTLQQDRPSALLIDGVPTIKTQKLTTAVTLKDRQTVMLGGIQGETHSNGRSQVPLLSDIPLLGHLFTHKQREDNQQRLLIFVTLHVLPLK